MFSGEFVAELWKNRGGSHFFEARVVFSGHFKDEYEACLVGTECLVARQRVVVEQGDVVTLSRAAEMWGWLKLADGDMAAMKGWSFTRKLEISLPKV